MNLKVRSIFLLIFFSISVHAQEYSGKGEDIQIILNNIEEFSNAYINANYDKLTSLYSEDAKIFPDGADIIVGHEAIKKRWILPKGIRLISHKVAPKEIKIIEDYAYDFGYYQGSSINKDGESALWKGKYVIVWKKTGENWKIYLDIWNRVNNSKK